MTVPQPKLLTAEQCRAERDRLVAEGKTLVFTNGCLTSCIADTSPT